MELQARLVLPRYYVIAVLDDVIDSDLGEGEVDWRALTSGGDCGRIGYVFWVGHIGRLALVIFIFVIYIFIFVIYVKGRVELLIC